ncbi:MAG: LytTR family transcriptional regulator DNA-binding domain-containing protein [Lachnospiraceae bacterium]|nr:LytTR family transcriptional regulator DNA-binding domain-containing protein [Lachnospiraceae bacterium]
MKLIKTKEENLEENYLELHYDTIDEETSAVLDRLRDTLRYIEGTFEDKKVTVALTDIFYIETVDRKTFAYTKDMCVEIKEALRDILEEYSNIGFARISKSTVVNIYKIKKLQGDINMRVIIFLKNDEKLIMNRSFKNEFYERLNKLQGRKTK